MEINGKVVGLLDEFKSQSGKVKRGFILETSGQYPQKLPFDVWGDERWSAMGIMVGSNYSVSFDINSREWQNKYFVSLVAWKAVSLNGGTVAKGNGGNVQQPQSSVNTNTAAQSQQDDGDVPF